MVFCELHVCHKSEAYNGKLELSHPTVTGLLIWNMVIILNLECIAYFLWSSGIRGLVYVKRHGHSHQTDLPTDLIKLLQ